MNDEVKTLFLQLAGWFIFERQMDTDNWGRGDQVHREDTKRNAEEAKRLRKKIGELLNMTEKEILEATDESIIANLQF